MEFSSEFCEICKNAFFAEQHRTTNSDYSSISSSAPLALANETVNYDIKALREKRSNSKSSYYGVNLRIQSEYRKILTRKNTVFGHFLRSETKAYVLI